MKLQVEDGIVEVVTLQRGDVRLTVGANREPSGSVVLTPREVKVVLAALEAAAEEPL